MAWQLNTIMDAIATTATSGNVVPRAWGWPNPIASPPCLVVGYPTRLDYDYTFHATATDGSVDMTIPFWIVVGKMDDKMARDQLSAIMSGVTGIKRVMDGNLGGTVDTARVVDIKVEAITIATVEYLAAHFDMDVIAQ